MSDSEAKQNSQVTPQEPKTSSVNPATNSYKKGKRKKGSQSGTPSPQQEKEKKSKARESSFESAEEGTEDSQSGEETVEMEAKIDQLLKGQERIEDTVNELKRKLVQIDVVQDLVERIEIEMRKKNVIFFGLPEIKTKQEERESPTAEVTNLQRHLVKLDPVNTANFKVDDAFRLGKFVPAKTDHYS